MRGPRAVDAACNVNAYGATRLALVVAVLAGALFASAAPASAAACFPQPSSCGYPDATNSGVPAGTALTSSGSVTLSSGQTLNARDVTGSVNVTGPNVTIENSKIHTNSGGNGTTAVTLQNGATNFKLINSEVYGNGSKTNAPESGVWNHYNNAGAQVIGSYIHGSPDNWEGRVDLVEDSYMIVDAEYSGAHSENIYICGSTAIVDHSTLYNESDETSLIFGDGICGNGNTVSVTDSMLAGGGFMLEPNAKGVSAPVTITGNRVGRCLTPSHQDSGGGYVCSDGGDSNGYWPRGGHYGISADLGNNATWSGNIWDDNSQAVCASGNPGCGGTTPPPPPPDNPAQAVWTAPTGVTVGVPVTLNGSASTGDAPIACTWTRETQGGTVLETKTGCQISYTFQSSGTQYMRLKVTDLDGDTDSSLKTISVAEATPPPPPPDNPAQAVWTAPTGVTVGVPVTLNGSASTGDAPIACTWTRETQGGAVLDTNTGCQLTYTFQSAGTQYMRLAVTDVDGDTDSSLKTIDVAETTPPPPPPDNPAQAVWTAPTGVTVGVPVTLNGSASAGDAPIACTWTRETQAGAVLETKTGCQISYTFQSSGTQYMRLAVTDVDGDTDSSLKTISVAEATPPPPPPDTPPDAVWTAPESATVGVPVILDATASTGGDESLECTWSFENQSGAIVWETHTGCQIPFTFQIADTKYVELTVTNSSGESDTNRQSFPVTATAPEPPEEPSPPEEPTTPPPPPPPPPPGEPGTPPPHTTVQAIWYLPSGAKPGQTVMLDGTGSKGDGPLSCVWTIESRSGSRVYRRSTGCTFTYRIPQGTQYVRLTVRDRYGASDSLRRVVSGRTQAVTVQSSLLHSRPQAAVGSGHRASWACSCWGARWR